MSVKEIKKAFTLFNFCYWLGVFGSLFYFLFQQLLSQVLSRKPFYLSSVQGNQ